MPVARPQINKLKRLRQQAHLDSTLESGCKAGRLLFGEIKTLLNLLEKSVVQLRAASRDEFFRKQPLLDRELKNLSAFIDTLADGLENFKSQSTIIKDLLESDNGHFNGNTNGNGHTNGNSNGSTNGYTNGGTNGNTNGLDLTGLVIDPFKWTPEFPTVPHGKPMLCSVAHINDPSDFYIHPYYGSGKFVTEVQHEQIKLIKKGILRLPEIKPKMYCCARYEDDTYWYRARIIDIIHRKGKPDEIEKVKVFYLDYGNEAEVTVDDLMPMSITLAKTPVKSVNCHLGHYDPEEGWPDEATIVMRNVISETRVKITFSEDSPRFSENGCFPYYPVDFCLKSGSNLFEFLRQFINR